MADGCTKVANSQPKRVTLSHIMRRIIRLVGLAIDETKYTFGYYTASSIVPTTLTPQNSFPANAGLSSRNPTISHSPFTALIALTIETISQPEPPAPSIISCFIFSYTSLFGCRVCLYRLRWLHLDKDLRDSGKNCKVVQYPCVRHLPC